MTSTRSASDSNAADPSGSESILILSPTGRDAALAAQVLSEAGFTVQICKDIPRICELIRTTDDGTMEAGVLLIAEEALASNQRDALVQQLSDQPPWSDIPIILLSSVGVSNESAARVLHLLGSSGNVTLLERPLKTITLISAIQVALRSRRRQYQIRGLLEQREAALESISAARQQAEDANRTKDQFLATLSHELRTPLNAILGWAQILREELEALPELDESKTVTQGVEVIERNAKIQAQLIEDLLDVSRIISGKLMLESKPVDVAKVLLAAKSAIAPQVESRGIELTLSIRRPMAPIIGDPARIQQIVWNLLSNALKFTPAKGTISLSAYQEGESVCIIVRDSGEGMTPEFLPFVFERFRQADPTTTRRQGGLGLGLSIVRQLVELHKGTVTAQSEGRGKGSTFILTFPAAVEAMNKGIETPIKPDSLQRSLQRKRVQLGGMRILVVDDDPDARDLVKRLLLEEDADVLVAESVSEALAVATKYHPDLLISDIGMPDEDGYDLIRQIRASPDPLGHIPAIALTAYASSEDRNRSQLAGFQYHLAKPVDPNELRSVVASISALAEQTN